MHKNDIAKSSKVAEIINRNTALEWSALRKSREQLDNLFDPIIASARKVVPGEHSDHRRYSLGADERLLKLEGVLHQRPGAWHEQAVANFQVVERLTRRRREKEVFPNLRRSPLARVVVETLLTQPVDGVRVRRD